MRFVFEEPEPTGDEYVCFDAPVLKIVRRHSTSMNEHKYVVCWT
jgi:hypothetical protein